MENNLLLAVGAGVFGLFFGSFAGAQVWRLRLDQLKSDKKTGDEYDKNELKKLNKLSSKNLNQDRSKCLDCGHNLAPLDLVPLVSWLSTGGKCRYCHKKIGHFEPAMEILTATVFFFSTLTWDFNQGTLGLVLYTLLLVCIVILVILGAYDFKWGLLPDKLVFPLIAISVLFFLGKFVLANGDISMLTNLLGSLLILPGLYFALWFISKGVWIGFGDVKLLVALAILLNYWQLAFCNLFLANLLGSLIVVAGMALHKIKRTDQVPFGPFLIAGFFISFWLSQNILSSSLLSIF